MLEPNTNSSAPLPEYTPPPGVFGTRLPSAVTFAVAVLLFVMPFIEITCNAMTLQNVSGIQLATGFKVKSDPSSSFLGDLGSDTKKPDKLEREKPNLYALIALVLGVVGFVLSMRNLKSGGIGGLITGIASAGSLIGLMVDMNTKIKLKIPTETQDMKISIGFTPWFYITIITFLAAAFFSYKRMKANYM